MFMTCLISSLCVSGYSQYGNLGINTRFDQVYTELYGSIYDISKPIIMHLTILETKGF